MALISCNNFADSVHESGWTTGSPGGTLPAGRPGATLGSSNGSVTYTFQSTNTNSIIFGCAFYVNASTWTATSSGAILRYMNGSTVLFEIHSIASTAASQLGLYAGSTLVATSTASYSVNTWYYGEMKVTPGAAGTANVRVRINGAEVFNYSPGSAVATTGVGYVCSVGHGNGGSIGKTTDTYIVDSSGPAPFNDFLGDISVVTLLPNGNGDTNQWLGSDGNSTDNYLLVDEANSSSTDYVGTAATGQSDLYQVADLAVTGKDVLAVQPLVYIGKNDTGTPPAAYAQIKQGGVIVKDASPVLAPALVSTTYQSVPGAVSAVAPDGGNWTIAKVNATQVGVST